MLLQNGTHERLYPLRYSGGGSTSKGIGVIPNARPLHGDVLGRAFIEDNAIPADATEPPYVLEVDGTNPTPDDPEGGRGAIGLNNLSQRSREIRRLECDYRCRENPPGVTLREPSWKS